MPKYIDADAFIGWARTRYCKDCDRRKGMKNGKMRFCYDIGGAPCRACDVDDMVEDVDNFPAADVEEGKRGEWISVKERLPNRYDGVVVIYVEDDEPEYLIAIHDGENWIGNYGRLCASNITHWFAPPEPPEVEE